MGLHKNVGIGDVHIPFSFEYANSTEREAATGFVASDDGKWARDLDSNAIYMVVFGEPVTWQRVGDASLPAILSTIQLDPNLEAPAHNEGLVFYDEVKKCLAIYNDQTDVTWQLGREFLVRCRNKTGKLLLNGRVVSAVGVTDNIIDIDYSTAASEFSPPIIGMLTNESDGTGGDVFCEVTRLGMVNDVNTSHLTPGIQAYLTADIPATGLVTNTPPPSPNWEISIGGAILVGETDGKFIAGLTNHGNTNDTINVFNGSILENHHITVNSDGADVTLTLTDAGADYLSLFISGGFTKITVPAAIDLIPGTDENPYLNYVYIPSDTKVLTVGSEFPTELEYVPIGTVLCQSAPSVQDDGAYKVHPWTNRMTDQYNQGHISHLNKWIRYQHATWLSGVQGTITGTGTGVVKHSSTTGRILRLTETVFPAFAEDTPMYVVNDPVTPYRKVTDFSTILTDSLGETLENRTFALVLWGSMNLDGDSKIYINLPSGSEGKNKPAAIVKNDKNFTLYSIPVQFKGTGFLMRRLIMYIDETGTTWTVFDENGDDLRGTFPSSSAGGGGSGAGTQHNGLIDIQGGTAPDEYYHLSAAELANVQATHNVEYVNDMCLDTFMGTLPRNSEINIHGGLNALGSGPLSSGDDIVVTKGTGKVVLALIAGSDYTGDITITGTKVDRDTAAETADFSEVISVDELSTDSGGTDVNGFAYHDLENVYLSANWYKGTVTITTSNVSLTDVDVYHCSFEQFNDSTDVSISSVDINIYSVNAGNIFAARGYTVLNVTGNKFNIQSPNALTISSSLAGEYYRLRSIGVNTFDGTKEGMFLDTFATGNADSWTDFGLKIWIQITKTATVTYS